MSAAIDLRPVGGYKEDPEDTRDKSFAVLKPALKLVSVEQSDYIIEEKTPLSDQIDTSTCVANASMDAFEILLGIEGLAVEQLSRLFAYWIGRMVSGGLDIDNGTYIRAVFAQIKSIGVCLEKSWPFQPHDLIDVRGVSTERILAMPGSTAFMEADSNKIDGYYRIASMDQARLDDIETAVRANHPVVFGTGVTKPFQMYRGGGSLISPPASLSDIIGLHAMIVTGVRYRNGRRNFLWRNSWGQFWGDVGHAWVDETYMTFSKTTDLWVPTRINPILAAA
jgi:hypothetical protein